MIEQIRIRRYRAQGRKPRTTDWQERSRRIHLHQIAGIERRKIPLERIARITVVGCIVGILDRRNVVQKVLHLTFGGIFEEELACGPAA